MQMMPKRRTMLLTLFDYLNNFVNKVNNIVPSFVSSLMLTDYDWQFQLPFLYM